MLFDNFKAKLDANNMSLKDFSEHTGLSYSAVTKWKYLKEVPTWTKSWFEMYEKVQKIDEYKRKIIDFAEELKTI